MTKLNDRKETALTAPLLYGNRESGHRDKVALALALVGIPFEQRGVDLNLPSQGLRSQPGREAPYDLLEFVPPIRSGIRS